MDLYHADIRLPDNFVAPTHRVNLVWTRHADHARRNDRYGTIARIPSLPLSQFKVVEIGMEGNKVAKMVVRGRYSETMDAVFVLIPNGTKPWIVKTVWFNKSTDAHKTLDRSKYVR